MSLICRAALATEEDEIVALWEACGLVVSYNDPTADFRFARAKPGSEVLVAVDAGKIVGSVMVGHEGHRGWLYYVSAEPSRRGEGIGTAIVTAAEEWLRARGVPKAMLLVRDTNIQIQGFYERLGFETSPRVVMQKWLKPGK